jgi:RsiW-degrading membrane proteinase PrsW (M82 family)
MFVLFNMAMMPYYIMLLAMLLEYVFEALLFNGSMQPTTNVSIEEAIMVGLVEEGSKLFFLYRATWRSPEFNYRYDGILYAGLVSLGFAAFENIMYVFSNGLGVAVSRALLSIPAHLAFGVLTGVFYSRAKVMQVEGSHAWGWMILLGWLVSSTLHACYDGSLFIGSNMSMALFVVIVVVIYLIVFVIVKKEAKNDRPIY